MTTILARRLPAFIAAFVGTFASHGPMPPLPRDHHGPGPFMRRRSQAKRRKLARRTTR